MDQGNLKNGIVGFPKLGGLPKSGGAPQSWGVSPNLWGLPKAPGPPQTPLSPSPGPITSVCFSKDGQCLLCSSLDSTLRLLDKDTGELLGE